jgi:tetratricopeptide (TPR) repeat protein
MKKESEEKRLARKSLRLQHKDAYSYLVTGESLMEFPALPFDSGILPTTKLNKPSEKQREVRQYFEEALEKNGEKTVVQHCIIYLSWLDVCDGNYAEGMEKLEKVDLVYLQSDEALTNPSMILVFYTTRQLALHFTSRSIDPFASLSIPKSTGALYWFWYEWLVYVYAVLLSRDEKWDELQQLCASYLELYPTELLSNQGNSSTLKKVAILRAYLNALILKLRKKDAHPLSGFAHFDLNERIPAPTEAIIRQAKLWIGMYERLVVGLCPFPKPESINSDPVEKQRYERVLECYDWHVMLEMYGRFLDDGIGDVIDRSYHLLETLYRATTHTFHSLSILRYIAHTFLVLTQVAGDNMCLDEKREALNAVESYLFHWENEFTLLLDTKVKEKRDQELEKMKSESSLQSIGKPSSPTPFLSHRLSGQISQRAPSFGQTMPGIAGSVDYAEPHNSPMSHVMFEEEAELNEEVRQSTSANCYKQVVVVSEVQGESVPDVIGVLITGIRMTLLTHEGNLVALKEAAMMGEKALIILNEHGTLLTNYHSLLCNVNQWLGVVYGELGLETIQREERIEYQTKGMESFQKAVDLENSAILRYQYAISLVELGEFEQALTQIQAAIGINPAQPMFYNLLALMLDSREQVSKAIEVCKSGWKCCIEYVLQTQVK